MRAYCIILTREGRIRCKYLKLEHGLLHDRHEKKSYAVIADAYPTNLQGPKSRAYFIHETSTQTVRLASGEEREVYGGTVAVSDPLSMVAKIRMPGPRGEDGEVRDVHLTPESIYDRTLSAQVRRLGNRRIQWFHALLFVSLGVAICLALVAAIMLLSSGGGDPTPPANLQFNGNTPLQPQPPESAPTQQPDVVVEPTPRPARPQGASD